MSYRKRGGWYWTSCPWLCHLCWLAGFVSMTTPRISMVSHTSLYTPCVVFDRTPGAFVGHVVLSSSLHWRPI
ncbi:hypothetical protein B0O80DRAFT_474275 [Mortierella sp. GBAus27b]|nr:hypothetical protein B0O80DRAFT_474275 [Mortierella sp. GBAus27b]